PGEARERLCSPASHAALDFAHTIMTTPMTKGTDLTTQASGLTGTLLWRQTSTYRATSTTAQPINAAATKRTSMRAPRSEVSMMIKSEARPQRRCQVRILGMRADIAEVLRLADKFEIS